MARMQLQMPWVALRTAVVANDAALATFDYDSWPVANTLEITPLATDNVATLLDAKRFELIMWGKSANNATAAYKLYARAKSNGPIILVCSGVATLGTQVVTKDPLAKTAVTARWVDTITIAAGLWADLAPVVVDSGNDRIAMIRGRNEGFHDYYLEIALDGGGGSAMTELSACIRGLEEDL
jgi:hypothetical protein